MRKAVLSLEGVAVLMCAYDHFAQRHGSSLATSKLANRVRGWLVELACLA